MSAHISASPPRATRRLGVALTAALALLGPVVAAAPAAHAAPPTAALALSLSSADVTTGDTFVATITGSGVSDLYSYDLEIAFDPALFVPTGDEPTGPSGGFTSAVTDADTVTVSHTRLGTSPGLESTGDVTLASVPFRAVAAGSTAVGVTSVRLVSSGGDVTTAVTVASAPLVIAAAPTPSPTPSPTATASPSPSASASPSTTPSAAPAANGPGGLAATGIDTAAWLISGALGVSLIAAGALFVLRRRQGVSE
ncbi:cohesin domain-containing protein [Microbacterium sp. P26]|uniref:cohesin domain-containing protein n=1 Tax=Microbacterium TaxID=33882 RepID=UPI00203EBD67|nr:cohesin domain-containing protein [Microbacterium sp. P26]MCM3502117.1 cohesin domain-containing protein [Microbacterium sp. P26]